MIIMPKKQQSKDTMVRVPRALQERYGALQKKDSWRSFPAFVREAIRVALERYETIEREGND
jgi:predicted DNA-binding protein